MDAKCAKVKFEALEAQQAVALADQVKSANREAVIARFHDDQLIKECLNAMLRGSTMLHAKRDRTKISPLGYADIQTKTSGYGHAYGSIGYAPDKGGAVLFRGLPAEARRETFKIVSFDPKDEKLLPITIVDGAFTVSLAEFRQDVRKGQSAHVSLVGKSNASPVLITLPPAIWDDIEACRQNPQRALGDIVGKG
jgi:hypothetical protein